MENDGPGLYVRVAALGFPKTYPGKTLLVALLGTNESPIAVVIYLLLGASPGPEEALRALLAPVGMASAALEGYLEDRTTPELPAGFVLTRPHALRREVAWGGVVPERGNGLAVRSFPGGEFARAGIGGPFRRHRVTE